MADDFGGFEEDAAPVIKPQRKRSQKRNMDLYAKSPQQKMCVAFGARV
jgi:hypothetical protein